MNFERFIASRYSSGSTNSFTKVIVNIAIFSIAISLSIMIITTSLITGFKDKITDKVYSFWGHIHITDANISRTYEIKPIDKNNPYTSEIVNLRSVTYQEAKTIFGNEIEGEYNQKSTKGGVKSIQPFITIPGLIQNKDNYLAVMQKGVDENYDWSYFNEFIKKGRLPNITADSASNEVIISQDIASKIIIDINDEFILSYIKDNKPIRKKMMVVGIYSTGLEEYDKKFMICDIKKLQELLMWDDNQIAGFEVFAEHTEDIPILSEYLYYNVLPTNIYSETTRNKYPGIFDWLELQNINEKVIIRLMIVVGIINMITVLLILILERANMIGLLKALGATNKSIRKIFLMKGAKIIIYGLILGNIIGLGLCFLQYYFEFITLDEKSYYLSVAPIKMNWFTIIFINISTFLIVLASLLLPSILVSKIDPISTLRYE
jgi:lipoprotein-releasing system permease protein